MQRFCKTAINLLVAGALAGSATAQQAPGTTPGATPAKPRQTTTAATAAKRKAATTAVKPKALVPVTDRDKQSYAIGLSVGKGLHRDSIDAEPNFVLQGLKDALADSKPQLTDEQIRTVMTSLQAQVRQKQEAKRLALTESNKKDGTAFLAANGAKPGVVTLPSGLQYKIVTPGTGAKPELTDTVICNYRGTLLDGTEFDSSYKRGQPATFPVGGVIKGWTEALQLMPAGSKWQLYIPADLAYGERGQGPIGPNATLVFDVELMSIQPKTPPPAAPAETPATPDTPPPPASTTTPPPAASAPPPPAASAPPPPAAH